nr:MAG TPA: hypothetical protein [Ackermannviridae sp.]
MLFLNIKRCFVLEIKKLNNTCSEVLLSFNRRDESLFLL